MSERISIRTLTDGGQQPLEIAHAVADFLDGAVTTLDLAQYDFHLGAETAPVVTDAIRRAADRGVKIRFAYNVDHAMPIPVPPPPETDAALIASLPVEAKAIAGIPDLMHHKYVIRDSWSRQENVIAIVESEKVAVGYQLDFEQLWTTGDVMKTGFVDPRWDNGVRAWFTPGHGDDLSARIAKIIRRARTRVRICSPVITTGPVLGTLAQVIADKSVDVAGCVDSPQMRDVIRQWRRTESVAWKLPLLEQVLAGPFSGKESTPYGAGTVHDFMHAKVTVCDDTLFVGSFNLSRSGEKNAENVLEIEDAALADQCAAFIDQVRARYGPVRLDPALPADNVVA
jgi:phosphatidylserine/phosphatidylglycerophosphate/cardiolipin synthase-like enzyme